MTFVGGSGLVRGGEDLLATYQRGYPTPEARGRLRFDLLEIRPLGRDHALVIGAYHLERKDPAHGLFTLVVARTPAGLRIVHDHSSAAPDKP